MPKFTWSPDPEAFGFVLPTEFLTAMIVLAVLSGLFALVSYRAGDRGGAMFGVVAAVAAIVAGLYWPTWQPWVAVRYYSLLFVFVFLGGYWLLDWQIRRGGGKKEEAGDFIVYGVVGVLAGARLGHVIFYDLDKALADPFWVLAIWTGGLASHGAVIGLIVAMWLFTQRRGVSFLEGADRFAFSAALGATLVRFGNFLNSEIVGREIKDGSWGVLFAKTCEQRPEAAGCWKFFSTRSADYSDKCMTGGTECWGYDDSVIYRHPSQLYEVALGLFVLASLFAFDRFLGKEKRPRGALISLFFALYFAGRMGIEFFKEYQTAFEHESELVTMGQLLSLPGLALGLYGLYWVFKRRVPAGWTPAAELGAAAADADDDEVRRDDDVDAEFGGGRRRKGKGKGRSRKGRRAAAGKGAAPSGALATSLDADEDADDPRSSDAGGPASDAGARNDDDDDDNDNDPEPAAAAAIPAASPAKPSGTRRGKRRRRADAAKKPAGTKDDDDD